MFIKTKLKGKRLLLPYVLQGIKSENTKECINIYYMNTNEIPGELSRENMISSRVKITSGVTINRILD